MQGRNPRELSPCPLLDLRLVIEMEDLGEAAVARVGDIGEAAKD